MSQIIDVDSTDFEHKVLTSNKPVLVDFWAEWCAPCRILGTTLANLEEDYTDHLKMVKINTEDNLDLAEEYGVKTLPMCVFIKDGVIVNRITGNISKNKLVEMIDKVIALK